MTSLEGNSHPMIIVSLSDGRWSATFEGDVVLNEITCGKTRYSKTVFFDNRKKAESWFREMEEIRLATSFIQEEDVLSPRRFQIVTVAWLDRVQKFYSRFGKDKVPCDIRQTFNQLELSPYIRKTSETITRFGPDVGADYHGANAPVWL